MNSRKLIMTNAVSFTPELLMLKHCKQFGVVSLLLLFLLLQPLRSHAQPPGGLELFRGHAAIMLLIDPDNGQIVDANNAAVSYYGYPYEQLLQMKIQQINSLNPLETEQEILRALAAQRNFFIFRHRLADGQIRTVEVYSSPLEFDGRQLLASIIHDSADRVVLKETIVQNEARLRYAEIVAGLGHWTMDLGTNSYHFSDGALELLGLDSPFQPVPLIREMVLPDDRQLMIKSLNRLVLEDRPYNTNLRLKRPDGRMVYLNSQGVFDPDSNQVFGVIHDISATQEALRLLAFRTKFFNLLAGIAVIILLGIVVLLYLTTRRSKRAEEALRKSQDELHSNLEMTQLLLNSTAEGIYGVDRQGICTFCNSASLKMLGYQHPDELVGHNIHDRIHHSHPDGSLFPATDCHLLRRIDEQIHRDEEYFWHADGSGIPVEYWSYPLRRNGETIGAVVTFLDIRERKAREQELRDSEARNRALVEAIPDMIFVLDTQGVFTDVQISEKSLPLLMPVEEFLGRRIDEVLPPEVVTPARCAMKEAQERGIVATFEYQLSDAGVESYYESRTVYAEPVGFVTLVRDISSRKAAEIALHQRNQEMEQFTYSVSHDLKSPLVTIKSFLNMLRQDIQDQNQQQIEEDLHYIGGAADRMNELLAALLELSRIGRTETKPQIIPAADVIEQCRVSLSGLIREHQIDIRVDDIPWKLHGDPVRLGQIWQNLVENAVKYLGEQPDPQIHIGTEEKSGSIAFFVRDNGIGIDSQYAERIFGLFTQLDPQSPGCGLGLPMVKKIVELYRGKVWCESGGKGKGSCFYFTLPKALITAEEERQ